MPTFGITFQISLSCNFFFFEIRRECLSGAGGSRGTEREEERENQATFIPSTEPYVGLNLTTLRS